MQISPTQLPQSYDGLARLPGFGQGVLVMTQAGELPVDWLALGDRIVTRDHGLQPVLWIGRITIPGDYLAAHPDRAPRQVQPGALGHAVPGEATVLAPATRTLLTGWQVDLHAGTPEALAEIGALSDGEVIRPAFSPESGPEPVRYTCLLLPRHALVQANGLWAETLLLDAGTRSALTGRLPASLAARADVDAGHRQAAQACLTDWELRAILGGRAGQAGDLIERAA